MKRVSVILILAGFVATGAFCALMYQHREPRYRGRTLTEWLKEDSDARQRAHYDSSIYEADSRWRAATNAVYQMGTNAVPWLLKELDARDSYAKARVVSWINSHPQCHLHFSTSCGRRGRASMGLILLKDRAKPAWPVFVQWTCDSDSGVRMRGWDYLMYTNADKETMIPVMRRLINDPNKQLRELVCSVMNERYPEEGKAAGVYKAAQIVAQ